MRSRFETQFLYLVLVAMQAAHSAEEYFTNFFDWFHFIKITGQTFIILNTGIIAFLLLFAPFIYRKIQWAINIFRIVVVIEILNGFVHIIAAFYTGGYFPGFFTAIGLVTVGILFLRNERKGSRLDPE